MVEKMIFRHCYLMICSFFIEEFKISPWVERQKGRWYMQLQWRLVGMDNLLIEAFYLSVFSLCNICCGTQFESGCLLSFSINPWKFSNVDKSLVSFLLIDSCCHCVFVCTSDCWWSPSLRLSHWCPESAAPDAQDPCDGRSECCLQG
jgi:hypothetical protein